jgi:hypothetical protein
MGIALVGAEGVRARQPARAMGTDAPWGRTTSDPHDVRDDPPLGACPSPEPRPDSVADVCDLAEVQHGSTARVGERGSRRPEVMESSARVRQGSKGAKDSPGSPPQVKPLGDPLLRPEQVVDFLQISRKTFYRFCDDPTFPVTTGRDIEGEPSRIDDLDC